MCDVPPRKLRDALNPTRIALVVVAMAATAVGFAFRDDSIGLALLGIGLAVLAAVLFPAIRDVELGIPGVKISAALRDREGALEHAIAAQKGDFGLYAQLLCPEPEIASKLLEASWAKAAAEWRGPVTADLRSHVLCVFVHLLESHAMWTQGPGAGQTLAEASDPMSALTLAQRTVVVLHEFADLPLAQIARITERSLDEISGDLHLARTALASRSVERDSP